jgi:hypothetical protein
MVSRSRLVLISILLITGLSFAQTPSAQPPAPDVAGEWSGTWSSYNPAKGESTPKELCKNLTSRVALKDGVWGATFEGDCGRPYKYTIRMEGRQVGQVILFKGTTDLGPKDGGVYDWIGRANDKEFVGFFTSAYYTGVFSLSRTK